jgi:hypothetical protein
LSIPFSYANDNNRLLTGNATTYNLIKKLSMESWMIFKKN